MKVSNIKLASYWGTTSTLCVYHIWHRVPTLYSHICTLLALITPTVHTHLHKNVIIVDDRLREWLFETEIIQHYTKGIY